ncbi:MAG: ABC transporter ATP-binding protein [Myxococcales bacterium]
MAETPKLSDWALWSRFWGFARPHRRMIIAALVLMPLGALAGLAQPWLLKVGIDEHIAVGDAEGLLGVAIALLGVILAEYLLQGGQTWLLNVAGLRTLADVRRALYRHVMAQSSAFFDRRPTGALLTRTTTDVEALGEVLLLGAITIFADVLAISGIVVAMLLLDVKLTLLTFAISPVLVGVVDLFRRRLRHYSEVIRRSMAKTNGFLAENVVGVKVVQLFGREEKSVKELKEMSYEFLDAYRRSNWYEASLYAIMDGAASICVALMLWYGGGRHLDGALTVGLLVAFIEYISRIFVPIRELSGKVATLQRAVAALDRVFGLLDTHAEVPAGSVIEKGDGAIAFRGVSFTYPRTSRPVLQGVSFTMRPGQVTALVGATGSGKTTIGKVLTRTVTGYEGSVVIDGRELSSLDPAAVREVVGVVHQDVFLFDGTVLENITLGNPRIDRAKAEAAARLVGAHDLIQRLPGGYDAQIKERGANLSSGQAQLLAFARAMAHDPPVLILDEATASIDSMSEAAIQQAIERILSLKTVLVIAHRLSTIQQADEILVLHQGEVVERGTHAELLAAGGRYARLHATRLEGAARVAVPRAFP